MFTSTIHGINQPYCGHMSLSDILMFRNRNVSHTHTHTHTHTVENRKCKRKPCLCVVDRYINWKQKCILRDCYHLVGCCITKWPQMLTQNKKLCISGTNLHLNQWPTRHGLRIMIHHSYRVFQNDSIWIGLSYIMNLHSVIGLRSNMKVNFSLCTPRG
jgi:hypothetical protein